MYFLLEFNLPTYSITPSTHPLFFFSRFYVFMHERYTERDIGRGRRREPYRGLNPRTLGSPPEQKADAQPLSYSDAPGFIFIISVLNHNPF